LLILGGGALVPLFLVLFGGLPALLAAVIFLLLGSLAIRLVIIKVPHALSEHRSV
jgi:hypothetical protein